MTCDIALSSSGKQRLRFRAPPWSGVAVSGMMMGTTVLATLAFFIVYDASAFVVIPFLLVFGAQRHFAWMLCLPVLWICRYVLSGFRAHAPLPLCMFAIRGCIMPGQGTAFVDEHVCCSTEHVMCRDAPYCDCSKHHVLAAMESDTQRPCRVH